LVAITNARIVTVSGPVIAKGTVLLRNGLIEAVGENIPEPPGAWVIAGEGLTVYPGLMDGLSSWGLPSAPATGSGRGSGAPPQPAQPAQPAATAVARGPEDRPSNSSYLHAADQLQPNDRRLELARGAGFTGAVVFPSREIFSGQGAVINLAGAKPGAMVVQSPAGQLLTLRSGSFGSGFPSSLMGVIAYIRQIYLDAEHYQTAKAFYAANPLGHPRPEYDRTLEGVLSSPRVLMPANSAKELERMSRLAKELKLNAVLYGAQEGYRSADLLKAAGIPVLLNVKWPEKPRDADPEVEDSYRTLECRDQAPRSAAALAKAGVKFAFYSGGIERPADIAGSVKKSIDAGLPAADALRAMTLSVAEIFGVADRLGSIDKGKIANLVVTKGDLFQDRTEIKYVFVDGKKFEPAPAAPAQGQEATR
jgi:hypothetical protein